MTIDKSLRRKGGLVRTRNVMKRDERIAKMQEDEKWPAGRPAFGLPKTRIQKLAIGKKKKKKEEGEEDTKGKKGAKGAPKAAAAAKAAPKAAAAKAAPAKK